MRGRDRAVAGCVVLVVAAALAGCAATRDEFYVPPNWPAPARPGPGTGYGAWGIFTLDPGGHERLTGELIAIGDDSTQVLTSDGLVVFATARVSDFQLATSRNRDGKLAIEQAGVAKDTGSSLTAMPARDELHRMRPYARFPQGVPAGVDPRALTLPR